MLRAISIRAPLAHLMFPEWWDRVSNARRRLGLGGEALDRPRDCESAAFVAVDKLSGLVGERLAIHVSTVYSQASQEWAEWFRLGHYLPRGYIIGHGTVAGVRLRTPYGNGYSPWHEPLTRAVYFCDMQPLARPRHAVGAAGVWVASEENT